LSHSQPFTNTYFHFLILVESVTSQVFLQRPTQRTIRSGMPDYRVAVLEVPYERRATPAASDVRCVELHCREGPHLVTYEYIQPLPTNSITVVATCRSKCWRRFAPRHEFNVDGFYCTPEYRHCSPSYRMTHFEFLHSPTSCIPACFVRGVMWCTHVSSPVIMHSSNSFPSFLNR
jgi:hypothetical protein